MSGTPGTSARAALADGRTLHYRTAGSGSPTVVFEAGMASPLGSWAAVVPGVADHTTAVAYDRAGYGASDPDPQPRTVARMAADLIELLDHLGDDRYVLVAHSWGGPIVRQATADRPDLVAGLVLVDPSDEDMELFSSPSAQWSRRWTVAALPWMRRLGLVGMGVKASTKGLPPDVVAELVAASTSKAHVAEFQAELRAFDADIARLQAEPLPSPAVPVTIITGVKRTRKLGPGTGDEARDAVRRANERRAASYPQGRHVAAERSTHYVPVHRARAGGRRDRRHRRRRPHLTTARPHPRSPMTRTADRPTRRRAVAIAALAALFVTAALSSCGGGSSDASSDGSVEASSDSVSKDADDGTVAIEHRYGTTEVPVDPERIVSLDLQWTDVLLALDAPPVGLPRRPRPRPTAFPWQGDLLDGVDGDRPPTDTLPYEQIAALKPDLIVVTYFAQDQADYDKLVGDRPDHRLAERRARSTRGRTSPPPPGRSSASQDEAAALISDGRRRRGHRRRRAPRPGGQDLHARELRRRRPIYVVSDPEDGASVLFAQLGMEIAPAILDAGEGGTGRVELSLEQRRAARRRPARAAHQRRRRRPTIPGYDDLPAVQTGAVAVLDYDLGRGRQHPDAAVDPVLARAAPPRPRGRRRVAPDRAVAGSTYTPRRPR